MTKKLLLTGLISLCSISVANAVCTPPTTLKCNCAHPIIDAEGKLACGTSYCGDKKCMPDGSCCPEGNYCESTEQGKQCCSDGQSCNATTGCVEATTGIKSLCENAGGVVVESNDKVQYCLYQINGYQTMTWNEAENWCDTNGMKMPTIEEMCPGWDGVSLYQGGECPELIGVYDAYVWSGPLDGNYAYVVNLSSGGMEQQYFGNNEWGPSAFCRSK